MERSEWLIQVNPVLEKYPDLKIVVGEDFRLAGDVEVRSDSNGELLEAFALEILFPSDYPSCFPLVWETGGKIPRIAKRHVMPNEGNLCLAPPPEVVLLCRQGLTTIGFFDNALLPRLAEEYMVRNGGEYQREYSHGIPALWEFYQRYLGIGAPTEILIVLELMINKRLPHGKKLCPCGSTIQFKDCHMPRITALEVLGEVNIENYHRLLAEWDKVHKQHNDVMI